MSAERGIWSAQAGGFISAQLYADSEVEQELADFIAAGEDPADLEVLEVCPDHEDEPRIGCQECDEEDRDEAAAAEDEDED